MSYFEREARARRQAGHTVEDIAAALRVDEERIERAVQSLDLCTAHYQGMRDAYMRVLRALQQGVPISEIQEYCQQEIERLEKLR